MKQTHSYSQKAKDPITVDFSSSIGYSLYYLPFVGTPSEEALLGEKFYALHRESLRCKLYGQRN